MNFLLDEGDPFSKVKVDKSISQIKSKRIFASVKETTTDGSTPNSKKIKIVVEEMPTGEISAGAGIGTDGGSFAFNIKENNWLGKGVTAFCTGRGKCRLFERISIFTDPDLILLVQNYLTSLKILKMINLIQVMKIVYLVVELVYLMKDLKIYTLLLV